MNTTPATPATPAAPAPRLSPRLADVVRRLSPRMVEILVAIHRGEDVPARASMTGAALRDRGLLAVTSRAEGFRLTVDGERAAAAILARDEQAAPVAPVATVADVAPITTAVRTGELAPGDVVLHHGMYIVLGEHTTVDRVCGSAGVQTVHHFRGDVTNADAIRSTPGGHVTDGLLRDDNRWCVQGTAAAWWQRVERCALGSIMWRTTADPSTCDRPATRTVRTMFDTRPACAAHGDEYARTSGIVQP